MILDLFLMLLHLHEVFLLALLHLEVVDVSPDFVLQVSPLGIHVALDLLLHLHALRPSEGLLFLLLPLTLHSVGSDLHVALARAENVGGALLGLVELFPSLIRKGR